MRTLLGFFCSLWLIIGSPVFAQETETKAEFFTGLDLSLDVLKLTSLATPFELKFEGGAKVLLFNTAGLAFEYGYGKLEPQRAIKNGDYTSEGTYFRAGLDLQTAMDPKNTIYFGMRYGQSQFEDRGSYEVTGQIEQNFIETFDRRNLEADWFEVLIGSESEVARNLFFGAKLRLRILGSYDQFEPIDVYAIPGYGRSFDKTIPAGNLYVKYRFSF
jgi:hypothetical protein